jgi:hypothetical protein
MNDALRRMPAPSFLMGGIVPQTTERPAPPAPIPARRRACGCHVTAHGGHEPCPKNPGTQKYGAPNWRGYPLWAYTVDHVRTSEMADRLRDRGAQGWELVSVVADLDAARSSFFLYFKRPDGVGL